MNIIDPQFTNNSPSAMSTTFTNLHSVTDVRTQSTVFTFELSEGIASWMDY